MGERDNDCRGSGEEGRMRRNRDLGFFFLNTIEISRERGRGGFLWGFYYLGQTKSFWPVNLKKN